MKIAVFRKYGPPEVIKIETAPLPHFTANQILIKNRATAVTAADYRIRGAKFPKGLGTLARLYFGLKTPRRNFQILGTTFSGLVEAVGENVTKFKPGDEVTGIKSPSNIGTYTEYLVIDENSAVVQKPKDITHSDAAGVLFGGTTALYFLRDLAQIQKNQTILIHGASGAVGTNAVQLAKYYGAKVTAVCSTKNIGLVKSLGADNVVDYTKSTVAKAGKFDLVFTAAPGLNIDDLIALSKPKGKILLVLSDLIGMLQAALPFLRESNSHGIKFINGTTPERAEDIQFLIDLLEKKILRVVIDKEYTLDEIVEAHRYAETGHKVGNVILNFS